MTAGGDALELYYYPECGFSQQVLNTVINLKIEDEINLKNIRENKAYERELIALCGNKTVPTLKVGDQPMREASAIVDYLFDRFM